jgi:hypothetical protein
MSERQELVHNVINELRTLKEADPFVPTADIDIVWVLSAPGTIKDPSNDGIYKGVSVDKKNIEYGIELVREITAMRLGKELEGVSKEDIEAVGPILYYNGEDSDTEKTNYPQNLHLQEAAQDPDFPLPQANLVIGHIEIANTPAQIRDFADYLSKAQPDAKVAVVSLIQHSVRVSRYLQYYQQSIPSGAILLNAPTAETEKTVGKTLREVKRTLLLDC